MFDSEEISRRALLLAGEIKSETKRRRRRFEAVGAMLGICLAVSVFVIMALPTTGSPNDGYLFLENGNVPLAEPPQLDDGAEPCTETEASSKPDIVLPAYSMATMQAGAVEVPVELQNPAGNSCLLTFEIAANGAAAPLYSSGLVAQGMCIKHITLAEPLAEGRHKAVMTIRAYKAETYALIGKASVEFTLLAE